MGLFGASWRCTLRQLRGELQRSCRSAATFLAATSLSNEASSVRPNVTYQRRLLGGRSKLSVALAGDASLSTRLAQCMTRHVAVSDTDTRGAGRAVGVEFRALLGAVVPSNSAGAIRCLTCAATPFSNYLVQASRFFGWAEVARLVARGHRRLGVLSSRCWRERQCCSVGDRLL
jgi:hypothetical protein